MSNDKNLMEKTGEAVSNAARSVKDGLKAAAEAMTPKPIKAGDKLILPSADPSMPPVIVPVKKRTRRKTARRGARTKVKPGRSVARKSKAATKRTAARKPAAKRPRKSARR
jgi:hypothetical protein